MSSADEAERFKTFLPQVGKVCGEDIHSQIEALNDSDRHILLSELSAEVGIQPMEVFDVVSALT